MNILNSFYNNVSRLGDNPCLHYKKGGKWHPVSWNETASAIGFYKQKLISLGVKPGDKVGILSATCIEWTIADMAILSLGAIVVPIYPSITADQIAYIINDAAIGVIFVQNDKLLQKIESVRGSVPNVNLQPFIDIELAINSVRDTTPSNSLLQKAGGQALKGGEEIATIVYTSGTTGLPKGVIITHDNIWAEADGMRKVFLLGHDEILLAFLPLSHVLARAIQFYQLANGCQAAYAESIEAVAQNMLEVKPHMVVVVPRFIEKIFEKVECEISRASGIKRLLFNWAKRIGYNYSSFIKRKEEAPMRLKIKFKVARTFIFSKLYKRLGGRIKFIVTGGAPLSEEIAKFFHALSVLILEGYGLTETFAAVTVNRIDDYHFGTVGRPLLGVDIKLASDGEILIKGGMVFKEYFHKPDDTKKAFTEDGWFKTGDIGEFSKDGFLRITDRKKDIIVTSTGKNIAPQRVEKILEDSPFIDQAVVFGDGKKYISVILSLNFDSLKKFALDKGISYSNKKELYSSHEVRKLISDIIEEKNKQLSHFENIRKFAIVEHDFTIETGELTPTMKVKRNKIAEKYGDVLNRLYSDV